MEATIEKIASRRWKSKMDKRSGFWQVELTPRAQDLLAFNTPNGRVFHSKVMPFGVANAPAVFQELMNQLLSILKRRPRVRELLKRGAEMEANIDDVGFGTETRADHLVLLEEWFPVLKENNARLRADKCTLMLEEMNYLGFEMGYGWWRPDPKKLQPLMDFEIEKTEGKKKGVKSVREFIGGANFYRRHVKAFTHSSATLTDLIREINKWE